MERPTNQCSAVQCIHSSIKCISYYIEHFMHVFTKEINEIRDKNGNWEELCKAQLSFYVEKIHKLGRKE